MDNAISRVEARLAETTAQYGLIHVPRDDLRELLSLAHSNGWQPMSSFHGHCVDTLIWVNAPELLEGGYCDLATIDDYGRWHDDEGNPVTPGAWQPIPKPPALDRLSPDLESE